MYLVVCSRYGDNDPERISGWWQRAESQGHTITFCGRTTPLPDKPDAIISMSVSQLEDTIYVSGRFPGVPLFCYHWDCYSWVWTNPRKDEPYDWNKFGNLLRSASEVWVPSVCTAIQARKWWGPLNTHVITSGCNYWTPEPERIVDGEYALCTLRTIPDVWMTKFEEVCEELGVRYIRTDHNLSLDEYRKVVEQCRVIVSHYHEASTGGLTIVEAFMLGKHVLMHGSPWHGGYDYLEQKATYFGNMDVTSFKSKLKTLANSPIAPDQMEKNRKWAGGRFDYSVMIDKMLGRIYAHVK